MEIVVQTLSEQIYALLRDRIISGGFQPSAALRQDALAAELGVSKIPLREAFTRLEQDGLLQYAANRGFVVRPLSTDEAEEVYALRLKIEPEAVGMAARKATDRDKEIARAALVALDQAAAGPDKSKLGKLNRELHMALVRPLGRQITVQMIERLNLISERYVGKHLEPLGREGRAQTEHHTMFEAWRQGQSKVVEGLMYDHIATTLEDLRAEFEIEKAAAPA
jgi:DNA-binding GntR family transcriptional regulator